MTEIPGYQFLGLFQTASSHLLFRAVRQSDQRPVLLKTPRLEHIGPRERARYEREHGLLQRLQGTPGVPSVLDYEVIQETPVLVQEDVNGQPLSELTGAPFEASRVLSIALPLVSTLAEVHRRGVIHKDIKPANILLSRDGRVWLTDFGLATLQQVEHVEAAPAALAGGTLAYMSPEQSGRMNRAVDYRTDFYSLGVTLYQLLTGQLPFHGQDALEWIHAHIAHAPVPPHVRVASVPPMLSAVVLKLLAKPAEERYQSAEGLRADLERCQEALRRGQHEAFPLGQQDFPTHFQLPQRLYGRERELEALHGAFERVVREGRPEWLLVRGYSGIGKSSVVHELHRPVLQRRGFFVSGKFNALQRDVPYATLAQAMRGLVQQVLAGSTAEVEAWRQRLLESFEGKGQVLVDVVPQLEQVVGRQPPVPELPPAETRNRFNRLFQRLLGVFATAEHPLVLFLDDLQWADLASLKLLQYLITHPDTPPLLLIGAYRDNEVSASHPLAQMLEELRKAGTQLTDVRLGPLTFPQTRQLVAEALPGAADGLGGPLAELLQEKTGGNPFFLLQLFRALHQEGLVARGPEGAWRWDSDAVRARGYSDNVVDFMAGRLRQLPAPAQQLLRLAACVGSTFSLETLALVSGAQNPLAVERGLEPVLLEGLVVQTAPQQYRFLHDRIQQAAYSFIPEDERQSVHLRIGRQLWARLSPEGLNEHLFEVVGHLNAGVSLLEDPEERSRLARLNADAGMRAKASTAHRSAIGFFTMAFSLLPGDPWKSEPELAFKLRLEQARSESASGNISEARQLIEELLPQAPTLQLLAAGGQLKAEILLNTGQAQAAAACLRECLERFGVHIPAQPTWEDAVAARQELEAQLGERPIESLIELPTLTDPEMKTVVGLLVAMISPAFFTNENLLALQLCRLVALTLRHGNTAASALGYVWYGLVTGSKFGDYRRGYEFGRLAREVLERHQGAAYRGRVLFILGQVSAWVRPLSVTQALFQEAFQQAVQGSDFQAACFSCVNAGTLPIFTGDELPEVYRQGEAEKDFPRKVHFQSGLDFIQIVQCFVQQMRGLSESFYSLSVEGFTEQYFESPKSTSLSPQDCLYAIFKTRSRFMCGAFEEARQAAERARSLLWALLGRVHVLDYHQYRALALAACYREASDTQRAEYLEHIQEHHRQLAQWAESCAETFRASERMVFAELERLRGRAEAAMQAYEEAIQAAHTHGLIQNVALASELAARFWKERGYPSIATSYARQAREAYGQWGAEGKVRHLEEQWPHLAELPGSSQQLTYDTGPSRLDALSLVKAQQAISSEIDLEKLVATLMRVALESAGAQRGALVLSQGEALEVKALVDGASPSESVSRQPAAHELPWAVLAYVNRTGEHVLVDDTATPHAFSSDTFFSQGRARSLLCLPLRSTQTIHGLLYLENSLAPGAFSPGRIALLQHLASHAVISLENARLYSEVQQAETALRRANEALEERVEERTRELKQAQARLVETARLVGMSEVASNVLHEVGNTLNSLVVTSQELSRQVGGSRISRVEQLASLLTEHQDRLPDFLTQDPRGRHVVPYLSRLAGKLAREHAALETGLGDLGRNVERVRSIVQQQQGHARSRLLLEECDLAEVVDEALRLQLGALQQAKVRVMQELQPLPRMKVDRHRLLQILLNLLTNARQSLEASVARERLLRLRLWKDGAWVLLEVQDNGQGLAPEARNRLFRQGFTTRKEGHGIGLHSSALAAQLMGGQLTLESPGLDQGATATLKLPTEVAEPLPVQP